MGGAWNAYGEKRSVYAFCLESVRGRDDFARPRHGCKDNIKWILGSRS
jgi:hypothetical protein